MSGAVTRLETMARKDHEKNCRNEPPWPGLTVTHMHVHETHALRERARLTVPEASREEGGA